MIYGQINLAQLPDGTDLGQLALWSTTSRFPAIGGGSGYTNVMRHVVSGGHIEVVANKDADGNDLPTGCVSTSLYAVGRSNFRLVTTLVPGQFVAVGQDCDNFWAFQWATSTDGHHLAIVVGPIINGQQLAQDDQSWPRYYLTFEPSTYMTDQAVISADIQDGVVSFSVNGRSIESWLATGRVHSLYGGAEWAMPQACRGYTRAGFSDYGPHDQFATNLTARDDADLVLFADLKEKRANDIQSRMVCSGTSNVTGASSVTLAILDPSGAVVAEDSTPVAAGAWSYDVAGGLVVPKGLETDNLTLRAQATGSSATDTALAIFYAAPTPKYTPPLVGVNANANAYFTTLPFRDLSKALEWRSSEDISTYLYPDFIDLSTMPTNATHQNWRDTGQFSTRGVPIAWPVGEGASPVATMPWNLEPNWVNRPTVLTLPPGLDFALNGPFAHTIQIAKNLATGVHTVTFTQADNNSTQFNLVKNEALAGSNYGLPTDDWDMSWRLAGDASPFHLTDYFVRWYAQSAGKVVRIMKGALAEEDIWYGGMVDPTRFVAGRETQLTDHSWAQSGMVPWPWEAQIELANRARKDLWMAFPRGAQESYIRRFGALAKSLLDAGRKVYVEASNEVWNFGYGANRGYALDGIQRGLGHCDTSGKLTAVYGQDNGSYYPDRQSDPSWQLAADWSNTASYQPGDVVQYQADIYACTTAVGPAPAPDGTTYDPSLPAGQQPYYYGPDGTLMAYAIGPRLDRQATTASGAAGHWRLVHDYNIARWRAHKEELIRYVGWLRDEIGDAGRVVAVGTYWQDSLDPSVGSGASDAVNIDQYMLWGTSFTPEASGAKTSDIEYLAIGAYMPVRGYYHPVNGLSTPDAVINAAPGAARQAALLDMVLTDAQFVADNHLRSASILEQRCVDLQITNAPALAVYEGGHNFDFRYWPNQETDQGLRDDLEVLWTTQLARAYTLMYGQMIDGVGGPTVEFVAPDNALKYYWPGLLASYSFRWQLSDTVSDTPASPTDAPYLALQALGLQYGGELIDIPIFGEMLRRRRFSPVQLTPVAA